MESFENNYVSRRKVIDYNYTDQKIMSLKKNNILNEIEIKQLEGSSSIFDNQTQCGMEVVSKLYDRKIINIMVVALTQSGKTGTMISLIKHYLVDPSNLIPIENIYIITGLSSTEWRNQTRDRMPKMLEERVFHRDNLTSSFTKDIREKKNVLVICDEIQIAAKKDQTLYKSFTECGFYDKNKLLEDDIKIIEFSATPDGTIYDLMNWGNNACKIKMIPGYGYTSCFSLLSNKFVYQYKDLFCYDRGTGKVRPEAFQNINEIKEIVDKYSSPRYHIIRTQKGTYSDTVLQNFKTIFGKTVQYMNYDKESDICDINSVLINPPKEHTFIFIKEKLRCAVTLEKKHLGILYERFTRSPDDAVIIQGLLGRATGYDNNGEIYVFTNIDSILKYKCLWESNFEDSTVLWKSKTTKIKNKNLSSKGTYVGPELFDGMSVSSEESVEEKEPVIKKFKTQEEVKEYFKKELKQKFGGRGPQKRKQNSDGYFEANIRSIKKIYSLDEIFEERKWGLTMNNFRVHPCYSDITDKSTLEFWIIHY